MGNCICVKDVKNHVSECTYENTPEFTFENKKEYVKVLRVIDGDTIDIALYHERLSKAFRHRVRLYGIDTPEKRPLKSNPNRELEIQASLKSKNALEERLKETGYIVLSLFYKPDKYGRLLCTFYGKNDINLNEWMVKEGYAKPYFGGTKEKFGDDRL
jgi:micrococcal nuclease